MNINYHIHTRRCGHAEGCARDYVLAAIDAGFKAMGFSDHCPLPFPDDYDSSRIRMPMSELPDYVSEILALREEFKDQIEIKLGFELEYYPAYFDSIIQELEKYPADYLIQGQHFVGNEIGEHYMGRPLGEDILKRYVDQTIEGMKTGKFLYLAHPDIPKYDGQDEPYYREISRLCDAAKQLDIPLEINLLGIRTNRNYPSEKFWKIAGEAGCSVVLGSDAHRPCDIRDDVSARRAEEIARKYNLQVITAPLL